MRLCSPQARPASVRNAHRTAARHYLPVIFKKPSDTGTFPVNGAFMHGFPNGKPRGRAKETAHPAITGGLQTKLQCRHANLLAAWGKPECGLVPAAAHSRLQHTHRTTVPQHDIVYCLFFSSCWNMVMAGNLC